MKIRTDKFEAVVSNLVFIAIPLFLLAGHIAEYLVAFISIALHESGHALAAKSRGCRIERLSITPLGLSITICEEGLPGTGSILIFAAGPAVNFLLAGLSVVFGNLAGIPDEMRDFVLFTNICLAVFNLIPALPLDGGRIMWKLLAGNIGCIAAGKILRTVAFVLSGILFAAGFFRFGGDGINICLSLTGLYIVFLLLKGGTEGALMSIKDIIYRKSRLLRKGIYPARHLVAIKSVQVSEALKSLDFDRFHFIYVLDENLKLLGILNENEIMESLSTAHSGVTFEDILGICAKKQDY